MHTHDQSNVEETTQDISADIAIVAMSGRFPGAETIDQFWQNLAAGIESVTFFSDEELLEAGIDAAVLQNPNYVKANTVLENIEQFDANFFDISPREAEVLDPQQRLFLECSWEALELAGYDPQRYPGVIGVYAGVGINRYLLYNLSQHPELMEAIGFYQLLLNSDKDFLPSRVAYKLNLTGAAVGVQTACSSSLVAIHLACQSLLNGETDMVLAGGATIRIPHMGGYFYQEGMIMSPDGHCRAFDAKAQGTVGGSGTAIVLLKRLQDAIADGDECYAVIKGSAINNDGSFKMSYTAPGVEGQAAVIAEALTVAEVEADSISYIEAHGTGTELGDPIEVAALNQVFRRRTDQRHFCAIGSLKTNLGHMDTAAGAAGLIKTALSLKHQKLPPSLNFEAPNPRIDFANSPFYVNHQLTDWPSSTVPRRAGVSSFGIGGTNAHIIVEEAPPREPSGPSRPHQLLLLSAKTASALETATANLARHLQQQPAANLADVSYTLSCGRQAFDYRRMLVCQDTAQAVQTLTAFETTGVNPRSISREVSPVVFLFPGQGSQYVNMGRQLYEDEPLFREQIDYCAEWLRPQLQLDLRQLLYPKSVDRSAAEARLQETAIAQPTLFVVEYALAQLWLSWGITPTAMIGHSIGEYVAACLAGVFSLEDGLGLVATRGQMMQSLPAGAMLAVPLSAAEIEPLLHQDANGTDPLAIAALNEPHRCVVSGTPEAIAAFAQTLTDQAIEFRRLHTSHAFHSPMMEPILDPFRQRCQQISLHPPTLPYISNLTGTWVTTEQPTDPDYWVQHLRRPVQFAAGLDQLCREVDRPPIWLEVGPGRTLSTLVRRNPASQEGVAITCLRHPQETKSDVATLLTALGQLWLNGVAIDWSAVYAHERRHRLPLPTYPFERQRYWVDSSLTAYADPKRVDQKTPVSEWFYLPSWRQLPLPLPTERDRAQTILIFSDGSDWANALIDRFTRLDFTVIQVRVDDAFSIVDDHCYQLNPQQREDYDHLIQTLQSQEQLPDKVLHLWPLAADAPSADSLSLSCFESSQLLGFYSLLFFAQAWGQQVFTQTCDIITIAQNLQSVTGEEALDPFQALLLGPVLTIPQENLSLTCRCVDILPSAIESSPSSLMETLIKEVQASVPDRAIAYRGNQRWVQGFEPFPLPLQEHPPKHPVPLGLRHQGVYLITGGLGNVGYLLAEHLAQQVQARLVLVSRQALPSRQDWPQYLSSSESEPDSAQASIRQKIEKVQRLEALGAEVLSLQADVSDAIQMAAVLEKTHTHFGPLNGVIHAAAVLTWGETFNAINHITPEQCQKQFQPKVQGTLVLSNLLKNYALDFCVLTSSLASVLGGLGYVSYTAANSFLDTFVRRHNQLCGSNWLSLNWDGWQQRQGGEPSQSGAGDELAALAIAPQEGIQAFDAVLASQITPQVLISATPLKSRIDKWIKMSQRATQRSVSTAAASREGLPNYQAPRNQIEANIAAIFQSLLGIDQIGINDSFFDLGGDSLVGMRLVTNLRQTFAVDLPIVAIFDSPTIAHLAAIIQQKQQPQSESTLSELDAISDILEQVEALSEEEVSALSEG
ncbi:SDR family oxidoreductase [Oscillatoria sp. CS-180]|uniref:type I polyketide synthase n=1 Tax=Oscillatoria sp. CS-180 TaxID=3021720 RepID=UPI00232D218F|nr:type I polyketide synthase [Oscillatoria sp. CS-180]MDB9527421.1 SDR family oxidoreductase [Oscillatoria sp. CS-180]